MKKKLIIIGVLLLIASLVGSLVIKMMYKKAERNVATELAITINPIDFATLYKYSEDSANKIYLNKTIQLTGVVDTYTADSTDQHYIIIKLSNTLPSISCALNDKYKSINVADTVTIKGICVGMVSDINFISCIVIDTKKYRGQIIKNVQKTITTIDTISLKEKQNSLPTIFKTSKAQIIFDAGGGIEDIKATNNKVEASIDVDGNINFKLALLQFKFADALMQQHFNDEYVESAKFPTAKFTGKIINNNEISINKDGSYNATIKGKLTLHGKTKEVQTIAQIIVKDKKIKTNSNLKIILADFDVKSAAADEADLKITANFTF